MKVDFMILGAQKCGTTTLFDMLNSHPDIVGSTPKEPHFFSTTPNWRENLDQYRSLFGQYEEKKDALFFEASTTYTFYPYRNLRIWEDLYAFNPQMKHIYIVRNPAQRIVSAYMHMYQRGYLDVGIEEALLSENLLIGVSRYFTQIKPFIDQFGRDRVLLLDFDDLVNNKIDTVQKVATFLEVDLTRFPEGIDAIRSNVSVGNRRKHHKFDNPPLHLKLTQRLAPKVWSRMVNNAEREFAQKPELNCDQRAIVVDLLHLEIEEIEKLLNKDLSAWRRLE